LVLLAAALAFAACRDERYPTEEREATRAVDDAKASGADKHSSETLRSARRSIDQAHAAEAQATRDERDARDQLTDVDKRSKACDRILVDKESALRRERTLQDDLEARQVQLEQHRQMLVASGVTEEELRRSIDLDLALAQARAKSSAAVVASLSQQVELGKLDRSEIDLQRQAAQARLDNAGSRRRLARTLYERAEEQAKLAETESLAAQRVELRDRGTP
jgi:hypothetical protein